MKFRKCTFNRKLAVYKCIKIFPETYKRFRELTKVDNKYTPVNVKKFKYNPWKSTDVTSVWTYGKLTITISIEDPYIVIIGGKNE